MLALPLRATASWSLMMLWQSCGNGDVRMQHSHARINVATGKRNHDCCNVLYSVFMVIPFYQSSFYNFSMVSYRHNGLKVRFEGHVAHVWRAIRVALQVVEIVRFLQVPGAQHGQRGTQRMPYTTEMYGNWGGGIKH